MYDVIGGLRGVQRRMTRRRQPNPLVVSAPAIAVAGLAALAGLLLWDERRRSAMRKRLQEVAGSVGSSVSSGVKNGLGRVTPSTPVGAGRD